MPKVSVIIPVYNVEPYIERCLHSLFNQTLKDIEYIFVDDGSVDNSISKIDNVLEQYPSRKSQVKVLSHIHNLGVAAARTSGIKAATGDYIIHCDPDDYVEPYMYERMYNRAILTNSDIVACHYWVEQGNKQRIVKLTYHSSPNECLQYLYKKNCDIGSLWDKLVRRSIIVKYNILPYKNINYAEDLNCVVRILHYAESITVVESPLYHYCRRERSITVQIESHWKTHLESIEQICQFMEFANKTKYQSASNFLKFYAKMKYRYLCGMNNKEWFDWYRECHKDVLKYDDNSLKSRIVLWIALQNYTVYKFAKRIISDL